MPTHVKLPYKQSLPLRIGDIPKARQCFKTSIYLCILHMWKITSKTNTRIYNSIIPQNLSDSQRIRMTWWMRFTCIGCLRRLLLKPTYYLFNHMSTIGISEPFTQMIPRDRIELSRSQTPSSQFEPDWWTQSKVYILIHFRAHTKPIPLKTAIIQGSKTNLETTIQNSKPHKEPPDATAIEDPQFPIFPLIIP